MVDEILQLLYCKVFTNFTVKLKRKNLFNVTLLFFSMEIFIQLSMSASFLSVIFAYEKKMLALQMHYL